MARCKLLVALCGLAAGALPSVAPAQVIEPMMPVPPLPTEPTAPPEPGEPLVVGKTVTDRPRPEVDPLGIQAGDFFFFPRIELDEGYNDNIFALPNGTGAWITTLMPSFDLVSNLPQNAIEVSGGAAIGQYSSHTSENFDDAYGAVNGRLDISALDHITAGLRFDRLHEPRTSPNSPGNAAEPVVYNDYGGNLGLYRTGTRITYEADASVLRTEYEAPPAIGGGFIPQDDRNDTGIQGALRLGYEFVPDYQVFVRASGNTQQFDHAAGNGIPIRNSNGYRIDVGGRIDLTGVTYAEFYIGYLEQDFTAAQFSNIRGFDYGAQVVWNATTLDTIKLGASRTVVNANAEVVGIATSPGYLASVQTVSIDHELLRDLVLSANAGLEVDDWKNIDRSDNIYTVGVGAKYLLNRYLYLGATYDYQKRESTGAARTTPYAQNIFLLRLSTQL